MSAIILFKWLAREGEVFPELYSVVPDAMRHAMPLRRSGIYVPRNWVPDLRCITRVLHRVRDDESSFAKPAFS